jgi:uncharacterized protein (DUF2336 family)
MMSKTNTARRSNLRPGESPKPRVSNVKKKLFGEVSSLLLRYDHDLSGEQRSLAVDVLAKLVSDIEHDLLQEFARYLSRMKNPPHDLLLSLANGEISISKEILTHSQALSDAELIDIIALRSKEHRLAIALRASVSAPVSDAIIEHDEPDVIEQLIDNHDVVLSRRALEYLVAESMLHANYQRPLLNRSDLPAEAAVRMYEWVSEALRAAILRRIGGGAQGNHASSEIGIRFSMASDDSSRPAIKSVDELAGLVVKRLDQRGVLDEQFLLKALRSGHTSAFMSAMAMMANISVEKVRRIVLDDRLHPLAVLCRSVGMTREGFLATLSLTRNIYHHGAIETNTVAETMRLFDTVAKDMCDTALASYENLPAAG